MADDPATPPAPVRRRSGSQKRQRSRILPMRVSEAEFAQIRALAEGRGLSPAALVREALLGLPSPRVRRTPTVDSLAVIRLSGVMGKLASELSRVGSNLNQVAHHLNAGRDESSLQHTTAATVMELKTAVAQLREDIRPTCRAILEALGQRPAEDDATGP